jgi:predicted transposase/invertase (TIGR01784 family)
MLDSEKTMWEGEMATPWDDTLKTLVRTSPQAFVDWIAPGARFVGERRCELKNWKLEVDSLLDVMVGEELMLLHIEFQSRNDAEMGDRLLRYNVLIRGEYKLPVLSCVIYLFRVGTIQRSPWIWRLPTGHEVNRFQFVDIEMFELAPQDLLHIGQPGLLPLLPLTRGGATREVVTEMLDRLVPSEHRELTSIGCALATLIFQRLNTAELGWFRRRISMIDDLLRESPFYQWILEEGEEKGLEKGRLQELRNSVIRFVRARYPALEELAEKQVASCEDIERLDQLRTNLYTARSAKKVKQYLLTMDKDSAGEA